MRFLVLGGTRFLSYAVAEQGLARGHEVTCAARGESGGVPPGADLVHLDRTAPDWSGLRQDHGWDAVLDVARTPGWVRDAVAALGEAAPYWILVSSISVYADHTIRNGTPETLPLLDPIHHDVEQDSAEAYGASKVGCEIAVQEGASSSLVVRPGLIVGPGDPSGRFSYWPERIAEGGDILAPGDPERDTQFIDVRDLAAWLVECAEQRRTGVYDASSRVTTLGEALDEVTAGVGGEPRLFWAHPAFLERHHVQPWAGPRSLPLWLPEDMEGMVTHDVTAAFDAGLRTRPIAVTAAETLAWLRSEEGRATVTGMTRAEEQELLDDWHTIRA
jgi:nucleoside-diphosphate-sugar epimerase